MLVDHFEDDDQLNMALELIDVALKHYPFQLDLFLHKAELLIRKQEPKRALALLQEALLISPNELDIFLVRAEALAALGDYESAMDELERLLPGTGKEEQADIFYMQSLILEQMDDFEGMFTALRKTIELDPRHLQALEHIGIAVEITQKYQESIELHNALLDEDPYLSIAWFNLGQAYAYEGQYEDALDSLEYAFLTNPKFEPAYWEFVDICFEVKDFGRALGALEDMREHFPLDGELLSRMGQCLFMTESYAQAKQTLRQALRLDPSHDEAMFYLGKCYAIEENWTKAMFYFSRAIRLNGEQESYYAAKGAVHAIMGNETAAEYSMRQAIDLAPEEGVYWLHLAAYLLERGQSERAWRLLQEARHTAFDSEIDYAEVACLFALDRREEALHTLEEALQNDFSAHTELFHLMPELKSDPQVTALIHLFGGALN